MEKSCWSSSFSPHFTGAPAKPCISKRRSSPMFIVTLCHLVVSFGKCFSKKSQHYLSQCLVGKWLDVTPQHEYKEFRYGRKLTFVKNRILVDAIARSLQGAIPLAVCSSTMLRKRKATFAHLVFHKLIFSQLCFKLNLSIVKNCFRARIRSLVFNQPKRATSGRSFELIKF